MEQIRTPPRWAKTKQTNLWLLPQSHRLHFNCAYLQLLLKCNCFAHTRIRIGERPELVGGRQINKLLRFESIAGTFKCTLIQSLICYYLSTRRETKPQHKHDTAKASAAQTTAKKLMLPFHFLLLRLTLNYYNDLLTGWINAQIERLQLQRWQQPPVYIGWGMTTT